MEGLTLPLPSARLHLEPGPLLDLYERVIGEQGLALRELRVKYPRDSFFSKGERQAVVKPRELRINLTGDDDLNAGRQRLTLAIRVPAGIVCDDSGEAIDTAAIIVRSGSFGESKHGARQTIEVIAGHDRLGKSCIRRLRQTKCQRK